MTSSADRCEMITPAPAEALAGLLGVSLPDRREPLPLCWHWLYLLDRPASADLGTDGHPVRGVVAVPPAPGLRRMWVGGRVEVGRGLVVGMTASRHSEVTATRRKTGRQGPLTLVDITHTISQGDAAVITEIQTIAYRSSSPIAPSRQPVAQVTPVTPVTPVPSGDSKAHAWMVDVTPPLLFRFSALTYNAHRIHYDREYARQVEGYPGLLVHGPLQAIVMVESVRALLGRTEGAGAETGRNCTFRYRLVSPLFDHQGLLATAEPAPTGFDTAISDASGRLTAHGLLRRSNVDPHSNAPLKEWSPS